MSQKADWVDRLLLQDRLLAVANARVQELERRNLRLIRDWNELYGRYAAATPELDKMRLENLKRALEVPFDEE